MAELAVQQSTRSLAFLAKGLAKRSPEEAAERAPELLEGVE
jgi:hypothetical protein